MLCEGRIAANTDEDEKVDEDASGSTRRDNVSGRRKEIREKSNEQNQKKPGAGAQGSGGGNCRQSSFVVSLERRKSRKEPRLRTRLGTRAGRRNDETSTRRDTEKWMAE